jgi:hypothetical protein
MNSEKLISTNKPLKQSLDFLVTKDPDYKRANEEQKEMMIRGLMAEARELAKARLLDESVDLKEIVGELRR